MKDHTAVVNERLPDLHRYQNLGLSTPSTRLTLRVNRRQADMVKFKEGNKLSGAGPPTVIVKYVIIIVSNTSPTYHYVYRDRGLGYR